MELAKLKEYLYNRLTILSGISVYNERVPLNATYPFLVYKLPSSSNLERNRTDYILELDFWNDTTDDSSILVASNLVKQGFNYGWQSENEGFFQSHLEFEGTIPDIETDITRLQQRYLLKVR